MNKKELKALAWERVESAVKRAKAMYYDGCHKIYLAMDDEQVKEMRELGYLAEDPNYDRLLSYYNDSCPLRLVYAMYTMPDGRDEFDKIIPQGFND